MRRPRILLLLTAAGLLCAALAGAEESSPPPDDATSGAERDPDAEETAPPEETDPTRREDEATALDLQDEVETIRAEHSAGRELRELVRVRFNINSRFVTETAFDGFDATLYRPGGRLKVTVPVSKRAALRLVATADSSVYEFDGVDPDPFGIGATGGDPFDELHSLGMRLQGGYRFDDWTLFSERETWSILGEGFIRSSWEDGSDIGKGRRVGGGVAVGYRFGNVVEVAVGASVSTKLVKSGLKVGPRIELDWKITDRWRLTSFGQGLQILYAWSDRLAFFARGRLENRSYRLDQRGGGVGKGSIRDSQIPVGLGVRWGINELFRVTAVAGAIAQHEFRIRNSNGDSVGRTVTGDPAPYFLLRFDLRP